MEQKRPSDSEIRSLYERHGKALTAYACSFGLDFALAQDVVQQLFLKLLRGAALPLEMPAGYLYRAVRNACLNSRRDGAKEVPLESQMNWLVHREGNREAELALQAALSKLPEEQREIIIMRVWDGMTLEEAASATQVPLNTAASRYRYALEKLRETFNVGKASQEDNQ